MPAENKLLSNVIPFFYRRQALDVMIFTHIRTYRRIYPSVTLMEAASAFMKEFGITDDELDTRSIIQTFHRTNKDYFNAQRHENRQAQEKTG